MVSTVTEAVPPGGGAGTRPTASYRANLVTVLLSVWFTLGLFVDAWAHSNLTELETFFTPWHALFYSGFVATAGWIAWTVRPALRRGWPQWRLMPAGYAPAVIALIGFAAGGVADGAWHTGFGVEQDINILFSPSHLVLITTMFVIVTTPLRAMWADRSLPAAPGLVRLLPAVLSIAFATSLVLLFLGYADAISFHDAGVVAGLSSMSEGATSELASRMAVTTVLMMAPLLTLARRWELPFGAATILFLAMAGLSGALTGFENADILIAFVAAGVCVDLLAWWLRPTPGRMARFRAFAALAPLVTWTIYIVTARIFAPPFLLSPELQNAPPPGFNAHPEAVVELYTGMPLVQALIGLLLAFLLFPDRRSAGRDRAEVAPVQGH